MTAITGKAPQPLPHWEEGDGNSAALATVAELIMVPFLCEDKA